MKREVVIVRQGAPSLFGVLFLLFLVYMAWKWVLLILGILAACYLAFCLVKAIRQDMANRAAAIEATRQRADRQLYGWMSGDPRALYGWDDNVKDERR